MVLKRAASFPSLLDFCTKQAPGLHSWAQPQAGDHRGGLLGCGYWGVSGVPGISSSKDDFLWLVDAEDLPKPVCNAEKNSACLPKHNLEVMLLIILPQSPTQSVFYLSLKFTLCSFGLSSVPCFNLCHVLVCRLVLWTAGFPPMLSMPFSGAARPSQEPLWSSRPSCRVR